MNTIISTFDITKEALPDLLLRVKQGKVQIPDLQRSFCWCDELIIELLASISLGWPVGSIMLLEQGQSDWSFRPRSVEGVCIHSPVQPTHLILDGQQRTTALYMTLFSGNPVRTKGKRTQKLIDRWYYIDITKALDSELDRVSAILSLPKNRIKVGAQGTIDCTTPDQEYASGLFPIAQVFHYPQWRQGYSRFWQYDPTKLELIDRFEQDVIKRFEHYQIPVIQLRSELPKAAVCRVFEKTNTQGTELNFFDLATACFASEDFSLRHDWAIKEQQLKQNTLLQSVRETDFLACVTLVATYFRRQAARITAMPLKKLPGIACGRAEVLDLSVEEYRHYNEKVMVGYETAARFLHGQRLLSTEDLPYQIQLVALAAILTVVGPPHEQLRSKLEQWFWCGACCGMYTSWHEVRAARDMLEVPDWLLSDGAIPATIRDAHFSANRLLSSQQRRGAVYKSVSALLRQHRAIDFATGEALFDVQFFNDPIESHHIFPVAYCKRQGIAPSQYNCLINRTPLSQLSNQKIGGQAPSQYLQALVDQGISRSRLDAILRSHLIEPDTMWNDDFEEFLTQRTQALLTLIEQAMGKAGSAGSPEIDSSLQQADPISA
ncbi:GmrSD restriction endonuclease domain-containing protein [Leptolyngbya sp. AN03gr2]|uniref:GmrSD restriction endonuclease domain-containing protein n=1 Tax=unclassified Leptolyngbya TaxID=2650499 RepID=UPI003D3209A5